MVITKLASTEVIGELDGSSGSEEWEQEWCGQGLGDSVISLEQASY